MADNSGAVLRIRRSLEEIRSRQMQADVDRAIEILGAENGSISGTVRDLRKRIDALLDELFPDANSWRRALRWMGLTKRTKAADTAISTLLLQQSAVGASFVEISTEEADFLRPLIADALDDAYCVLFPHEAAGRAERERSFSTSCRETERQREFVARCLGQK